MKKAVSSLHNWHQSRTGFVVFGFVELAMSYLLISRAIDTGSLWQYGLGILLLLGAAQNLVKAIRTPRNGKK